MDFLSKDCQNFDCQNFCSNLLHFCIHLKKLHFLLNYFFKKFVNCNFMNEFCDYLLWDLLWVKYNLFIVIMV